MPNGKPCVVTINSSEYYVPCDRVDDLVVVDRRLINTSSSSITLYSEFAVYGDSTSGYPRITCPSNTTAYYRSQYNGNSSILTVSSYDIGYRSYGMEIYIFIVILGVLICQLFKR